MGLLSMLRRAPREGVSSQGYYPEPIFITNSRWWIKYGYRALLGRPLDNTRWTNSTFWRAATAGEDHRWHRLAGWQRLATYAATAYGFVLTLVLTAAWLLGAHAFVLNLAHAHLAAAGCALLMLDAYFIRQRGLRIPARMLTTGAQDEGVAHAQWGMRELLPGVRTWHSETVLPLALALAPHLENRAHPADAHRWVEVPRNYREHGGGAVEIMLPRKFAPSDRVRATIERTVRDKLGMSDSSAQWELAGNHPRLLVRTPAAPPAKLTYADVAHLLADAQEYQPLLGMGSASPFHAQMIEDSPHVLLSGGPGSGKSTTMKLIMMQALRWGWGVVILDWKKTEAFKWAIGLPGVTYLHRIEDIHDFGVRITEELDSRKEQGMEGRARVLVVRDEWNAVAPMLIDHWSNLRALAEPEEKKLMTLRSPALQGFAQLDFAGREYGLHDLLAGQKVSNRVFNGNTDMRECFGIRGIARFQQATWRMLFGNLKPIPKSDNAPGRWTFVVEEKVTKVQVPFITGDEAREFAMGGTPNPISPFSSTYFLEGSTVDSGTAQRTYIEPTAQGDQLPDRAAPGSAVTSIAAPPDKLMKLRDLVEVVDHLGFSLKDLQRASSGGQEKDETFPEIAGGTQFKGYLYRRSEVLEWAKKKRAAQAAESAARGVRK